jgi:hypothetical protein
VRLSPFCIIIIPEKLLLIDYNMKPHHLINKLLSLNLPSDDFAIFGSGPMFAHDIKDMRDLDIIARGAAWEKAADLQKPVATKSGDGEVILFFDGQVELYNNWSPGEWDLNALIEGAEIIEGIRFVQLTEVLKWKKLVNREKDQLHIRLIEEYLSSKF